MSAASHAPTQSWTAAVNLAGKLAVDQQPPPRVRGSFHSTATVTLQNTRSRTRARKHVRLDVANRGDCDDDDDYY